MTTVAIDFGTTNTVVAILEADTQTSRTLNLQPIARSLPTADGTVVAVIPSLLHVLESGAMVVGEPVRSQRLHHQHPERTFVGFKRGLAADFNPPPRAIAGQTYDHQTVAETFLNGVWAQILAQGVEPTELILTVPVGAFERYLSFLQQWSHTLDVPTVRFVDESTAAALRYGRQTHAPLVLVIDWGGGTLDLSLVQLQLEPGATVSQARVLAKADAYLGGEDIDRAIMTDYLQGKEPENAIAALQLQEMAERLKIQLSQQPEAAESWLDEATFTAYEVALDRDRLGDILEEQGFLGQLRESLDMVLREAMNHGVTKVDISRVVMVGGTCLIKTVQDLVVAYFGRSRVKVEHPFTAASHGALVLTQIATVQDYLQHSYALQLWEPTIQDYTYFTLFPKGTYYPCSRPEPLTLRVAQEGQSEVRLHIGEIAESRQTEVVYDAFGRMTSQQRSRAAAYKSLSQSDDTVCLAHLAPQGVVGQDRIAVEFEVDSQRLLLATVTDLLTETVLIDGKAIGQLE